MNSHTPTLYRQIVAGQNGTRIYSYAGRYYLVDGEIDCSQPDAGQELQRRSYSNDRDPGKLERQAQRNTGR